MFRLLPVLFAVSSGCGGDDAASTTDTSTPSGTPSGTYTSCEGEAAASPEELEWTLGVGEESEQMVAISNTGCGEIQIEEVYTTNPVFTITTTLPLVIAEGVDGELGVVATAIDTRPEAGVLSFSAVDSESQSVEIIDVLLYLN